MKNLFFGCILCLLSCAGLSAQEALIEGQIKDSLTGQPVPFCSFLVKGTPGGGVSDEQGHFSVRIEKLPATLVFNALGYKTISVGVSASGSLTVLLSPRAVQLNAVTINPEKIQSWHGKDAWAFIDFAFYDDFMLALVAMQNNRKNFLVLLDADGNTVSTLQVKNNADSLFTDCAGVLHLCARDSIYQVYYDYEKLSLPYASSYETFVATMLPCRCQLQDYYYFGYSSCRGQQLNYYYINWYRKGKYTLFYSANDSDKIIAFNQDYDLNYFLAQRRLYGYYAEPVDSIVAHMDYYRSQLPLSQREQDWLTPVHAPMVSLGNELVVFNCLDSTLLRFTKSGQVISAVPFYPHRNKFYKENELYTDKITHALYGRSVSKDGISTFMKIDPATGNILAKYEVPAFPFISNAVIHNGTLYFLWKDIFSDQPRKIWEMRLE